MVELVMLGMFVLFVAGLLFGVGMGIRWQRAKQQTAPTPEVTESNTEVVSGVMGDEKRMYQIVEAGSIKDLERAVRIEMLSDWEPLGGVAVDEQGSYQAMVPKGD